MILAKNSDREPNEAQNITFIPARVHQSRSMVRCTNIEIPQAPHTFACILSRPFWMFGGEMGVNEHSVAIGNEAVFTKERYHKKNDALLGMDILRLALERAATARRACDLIVELLDEWGQGGVHTMGGTKYYHNSYLIVDPDEAFVLETAGKHWVSKQVFDLTSISNCLTIEDDYDESSPGLEDYARMRGYVKIGRVLNFQRDFSDALYTHFARGRIRKSCSYEQLSGKKGKITGRDMMAVLREHNIKGTFIPGKKPMERICLHAGGLISSQTTGSMIALLKKGEPPLVYMTGTSAPCVSLYKPHTILRKQDLSGDGVPASSSRWGGIDMYGASDNRYDGTALWWRGEEIHRRVLMNYDELIPIVDNRAAGFEEKMMREVGKAWKSGNKINFQLVCRRHAEELARAGEEMAETVKTGYEKSGRKKNVPWWFALQWDMINRKAGITIE
jgi:secernin